MTRLPFLVFAALAGAGCYNPAIAPCQLACANGTCPDGLACNTQNACAATSTSMCDELPIDAPDLDAVTTSVTIEVRDISGGPLGAALVVFTDAAGGLVDEMPTGADGKATIDLPAGGGATVIRVINDPNDPGVSEINVTTYLDLWPGAHVLTQAVQDESPRGVTVTFTPPPGTAQYTAHASCGMRVSSSMRPINMHVPPRCKMFDVIVTAGPSAAEPASQAAVLPAQSSNTVTIGLADFKPTRRVTGILTNVPFGVNRTHGAGPWVTATLSAPVISPVEMSPVPQSGVINALTLPMDAGTATVLGLDYQPAVGGPVSRQSIHDRFPPAATTVDRDYAGVVLPWMGRPALDFATRQMSWPRIVPNGVMVSAPSFFVATANYRINPTTTVNWRLVGAPARIMPLNNLVAVTYPDIPGMRNFESTDGTASSVFNTMSLFQVEPAAERAAIQLFDVAGADGGFFKIPTLRHLTLSVSQ